MDSSPRNLEPGSPPPSNPRAPAIFPPPLDLATWLHGLEVETAEEVRRAGRNGNESSHSSIRADGVRPLQTPPPAPGKHSHQAPRAPAASRTSTSTRPGAHSPSIISSVPPSPSRHDERLARPAAYLAKIPPAVAGQRGHDRTFHAACVLVQGFDLTIDEARPLFHQWNLGCTPPWTPAELEHKLHDALRAGDSHPRGYLWDRVSRTQDRPVRRDRSHGQDGQDSRHPPSHLGPALPYSPPPRPGHCPDGQEANPHRLAQSFLLAGFAFAGGIGLRYWRDEFHSWDGSAYQAVPDGEIRAQLTRWIAEEFERLYRLALDEMDQKTALDGQSATADRGPAGRSRAATERSRSVPRPIPVTGRLVSDVLQALASLVIISSRHFPVQPTWLPAWPTGIPALGDAPDHEEPTWPAGTILPAKNALVHLPSLMEGVSRTAPPTPRFFNNYALEYDFDPAAPPPLEWLSFLEQIWGTDIESIAALQEWFGYLLTPDTKHQKILMMVGPKRSGRGTIARVLKALAGSSSVVNPTLSTLARPFGLASFIGKPIAVFPDARLSSRPDNAAIVECLLSISGEDDQTIDRKHMPAWTGKLSTRFVLISNELPRLRDVSGALAGRLIILRFTRSFYGQEDMALFDRLRPELPGILRWAIAGWERLNRRGRFLQPRSAGELVATMDELTSPIAAFLRDRCVVEPDATCPVGAMYESWRSWCQEHGRDAIGDGHSFGRDLHAAVPALTTIRPRTALGRLRHYQGIRLRTAIDPDADADLADLTPQSQTKNPLAF
jgi:putative DNA primase/helicase